MAEMLRLAQNDLADPHLPRLAKGLAQECVRSRRAFAGRHVVRRLEVPIVDLRRIDEVEDVYRLRLLKCGGLEIVLGQHDELPLLVLVPFHELFPADRFPLGLAHAFVADRRFVLGVEQSEPGTVIAHRAVKLDGNVDEPEADRALPD